ncbi:hypothetical protein ES705_31237 [subsurface metagenome]
MTGHYQGDTSEHQAENRGDGGDSPSQGVGELTVSGHIEAQVSESSPVPCGGELLFGTSVLDNDPQTEAGFVPQKPSTGYLEHEATLSSTLSLPVVQLFGRMCGSVAIFGEDEDGERIVKRLFCGREWCEYCREQSHQRRMARVLDRLMQISPMGYDDITFPLEVREQMRDPKVLAAIAKKVRRLYRRLGYRKVYTRWHFFGKYGEKYHPHLNVLYDARWLDKPELEHFKDQIRRALLPRARAKAIRKDLVINHQADNDPKQMMHWIKYVTKASFRERYWDEPLAEALYGFHNGCFAGHWDDPPAWRLTGTDKKYNPLLKIAQGLHPVSEKPITWSRKPLPWVLALMENPVDIGGGYYTLPSIRPPPGLPGEITQKLYWMEKVHQVQVQLAEQCAREKTEREADGQQGWWNDVLGGED